jgi:hypothetical protein
MIPPQKEESLTENTEKTKKDLKVIKTSFDA